MNASELITQLQELIAVHGDVPVMKEYFYGGYDDLAGLPVVKDVHACPWMADAYWGAYENHYRSDEHPSFTAIIVD